MANAANTKLINAISSSSIKNQLNQYLAVDSKLTFIETKQLLTNMAQGGMTVTELKDLNTMWSYRGTLFADDYTNDITGYFINGCNANAYWWGGVGQSGKSKLGNLSASMPQGNLENLVNKWFAGADVPMALVSGDTAAGISGDFKYDYATISGNLFQNGPSALDVNQGQVGDCYFLSALGAVANANPSLITDDFIFDNGDGTYGVRFFNVNGEKYYVTVDRNLAVDQYKSPILADPLNGELWVALAEKAYAQMNSQVNVLNRATSDNCYKDIEGGWADPLQQITGLNFKYYQYEAGEVYSDSTIATAPDPNTYKAEIISLLKKGSAGWLSSFAELSDPQGHTEFVNGHAYMLLGYDETTDTFKIRNPWGDRGDVNQTIQDYNYLPEFNLPIETIWGDNFRIALTDSSLNNPIINYSAISTSGIAKATAIPEGKSVDIYISRDQNDTSSVLYYSIKPNSSKGALDQPIVTKMVINFPAGSSSMHVNIPVFTDSLKEGTESFTVEFYKLMDDVIPFTNSTIFVKDGVVDKSIYVLTNIDSEAVIEGQSFPLIIERSDTSTTSTVYLDTVDQTAIGADVGEEGYLNKDGDYLSLHKLAVDFKVGQKIAIVDINTIPDFTKEDTKSLGVNLYKYQNDTLPSASGTLKIINNSSELTDNYKYTMFSDAFSEELAKTEGDIITYTVKRDAIGSESTIYLSDEDSATTHGLDYLFNLKDLKFAADQDTLTFSVETLADNHYETNEIVNIGLRVDPTNMKPDIIAGGYIKNVSEKQYKYEISSSASTKESAVEEGNEVIFTIMRNGSGSESTIYLDTFDGMAISETNKGSNDYKHIDKQALTFLPDETSKTITVKTYTTPNMEGIEDFNLGIYKFYRDASFTSYATAYVHDTTPNNYDYSLDKANYDVIEGDQLSVTITRSSVGTSSSVFLWTDTGSANEEDFEACNGLQIDFEANETSKTVVINLSDDGLTDELIYEKFGLYLYKYSDDNEDNYIANGDVYILSNSVHEINGTDENDMLVGMDMQDDIYGLAGNDKLVGGAGQDILTGGEGNDIFIFTSVDDSLPALADIIEDFSKGDKIDLSAIDANIATSKDDAFSKPKMGVQFSGKFTKPGQLFFDTTDGILYGNVDVDGGADFAIELSGITKLIASSLML